MQFGGIFAKLGLINAMPSAPKKVAYCTGTQKEMCGDPYFEILKMALHCTNRSALVVQVIFHCHAFRQSSLHEVRKISGGGVSTYDE
jgi:hypothetical protein